MKLDPKVTGIALMVAAGVLVVTAGLNAWGSYRQWRAASALEAHAEEVFLDSEQRARRMAERARAHLGDDARTALPAIDPRDPDSDAVLEGLLGRVPASQRDQVQVARNFCRAVRKLDLERADQMRGPDAAFVQHIADLRDLPLGSRLPEPPAAEAWRAPSYAVLRYAYEERVATAWRIGDSRGLRRALHTLLMLDPRHPAAPELEVLAQGIDATINRSRFQQALSDVPAERRVPLLRGTIRLLRQDHASLGNTDLGARIGSLVERIPAKQRNAEELAHWLATGDRGIEELAKVALRDGSRDVVVTTINRAFAGKRWKLVERLAAKLPAEESRAVRLAVAEQTWDTDRLRELAEDPDAYLPIVIAPRLGFDAITFHVTSPSGAVPRIPVYVELDNDAVHAKDITRFGSLVRIPVRPATARVKLEVIVDETRIHKGILEP